MKRREERAAQDKKKLRLLQLKFNTENKQENTVLYSNRVPLRNKTSSLSICGQSYSHHENISSIQTSQEKSLSELSQMAMAPNMIRAQTASSASLRCQDSLVFRHCGSHRVQVIRSDEAKTRNPNRMCLDKCGLLSCPLLVGENSLQLLSMRYNLISHIDSVSTITSLICLDLHANRIQRIQGLDTLHNLKVLLLGKNRIRRVEGLESCHQLVVLDLQNNLIVDINRTSGLPNLKNLRVLNLSGNQIKNLNSSGIYCMDNLQELDLQRNQLINLSELIGMVSLEKLHVNNNQLQYLDNLENSLKQLPKLEELSMQGNPVWGHPTCPLLLLNLIPSLQIISSQVISSTLRIEAKQWHEKNNVKVEENIIHEDDDEGVCDVIARERSIYNARKRWELIKAQTKKIVTLSRTSIGGNATYCEQRANQNGAFIPKLPRPLLKQHSYSESSPSGYESAVSSASNDDSKTESYIIKPLPLHLRTQPTIARPSTTITSREYHHHSHGKRSRKPSAPTYRSSVTLPLLTAVDSNPVKDSSNGDHYQLLTKSTVPEVGQNHSVQISRPSTHKINQARKTHEHGTDYLLEVEDNGLNIVGEGALKCLLCHSTQTKSSHTCTMDAKAMATVKKLQLSYLPYTVIAPAFVKLREKLEQADSVELCAVGLSRLADFNALADFQGLSSIIIQSEGNPLLEEDHLVPLWEDYATFRLGHWGLVRINDREISAKDVSRSSSIFNSLGQLALSCIPENVIAPLVARLRQDPESNEDDDCDDEEKTKDSLWSLQDDPLLRDVIAKEALTYKPDISQTSPRLYYEAKNAVEDAINFACDCLDKLILLENKWPTFLSEKIQDILLDYVSIEDHKNIVLQELENSIKQQKLPS